jgi:hypothetical protein
MPVSDLIGGVFDIFSRGVDTAGHEWGVILKGPAGFAHVAGKTADEVSAGILSLASLLLDLIGRSGCQIFRVVCRFLELVPRHVGRGPQRIARTLLYVCSGIGHLVLQALRCASVSFLVEVRSFVQV